MTKPMLIEALKPGMRAMLADGRQVICHDDKLQNAETGANFCGISILTTTNYQIINDEPRPWKPCVDSDLGWAVDDAHRVFKTSRLLPKSALRTKQAAEHKAKFDRIFTEILNMPGYGGSGAHIYFWYDPLKFSPCRRKASHIMEFPFGTYESAKAAADYANKLMEASHA